MQKYESQDSELTFYNEDNENIKKGKNDEEIYDSNKYISGARRVQNGTVPMNILQFQYPFNYNNSRIYFC